jgi:hypothetical protein
VTGDASQQMPVCLAEFPLQAFLQKFFKKFENYPGRGKSTKSSPAAYTKDSGHPLIGKRVKSNRPP